VTEASTTTEMPLRELLRRLLARRWLLLATFVAVFALVAIYTFTATPRYRSWARLRIDQKTTTGPASALTEQMSSAVPGASLLGLGRDELETEVGILRSDRVRDAVVDSLALGIQLKKPAGNRARILAARTVDPLIDVEGKLTLRQQAPGTYSIEKTDLEEVRNLPKTMRAGDSIRVGGFELTLSQDLARGGPDEIVIRVLPRYRVHELLDKRLSIERQEGGSRLVEVSFEDPDRQLAAQVVQDVIAEYVGYSTRMDRRADTTAVAGLQREVDSTARLLTAAESNLRTFEEEKRIIDPQEQASAQVKRISTISGKVDAISVERNALAKMLEIIDQRSRGEGGGSSAYRQLATFPSLITNRAIQDLLQSLVELENKRAALGATRTEANADYKAYTDRIREIERQLYQLGPQYLESLDQELATTARTVAALTDTLQALPAAATRYGQLVRERTLREATYIALQKQLKQAQLTDVLRPERVHVVDAARVANIKDRAFPKKAVMLSLGLVLAAVVALMLGLVLELL
jgi:uncharacterized protein involved in exopolysaccharide biosynthesis